MIFAPLLRSLSLNMIQPLKAHLSIIFILFNSIGAIGQMIPMTTTIRTPYGNVPSTYYVYSPRYYAGQQNISQKHEFKIVLKNDSSFTMRTRIALDETKHSITVKGENGKQIYFPKDTKSITRTTLEGERLVGIPADTCWLFKTYSGKINAYSFLAEPGLFYVTAIQDGNNGPIVPLTKENLELMIKTDDPKIMKLVEKRKFTKAIAAYNASH